MSMAQARTYCHNLPGMKSEAKKAGKEHYQRLRALSWDQLWNDEVARFDKASSDERSQNVGVVRAVGAVFSKLATQRKRNKSNCGCAAC
jgi:hypothetical protein